MKTYAILGGGGFVGVRLAQYLMAYVPDVRVVAIGRNPEQAEAFAVPPTLLRARYEYRQLHLASQTEQILALLESERPSVIVNLAAQSEEAASWTHSWRFFETNTLALAKLVEPLIGRPWLSKWSRWGPPASMGIHRGMSRKISPFIRQRHTRCRRRLQIVTFSQSAGSEGFP